MFFRALYQLLLYALLPFVILRLLWRSRLSPEYRKRIAERLGFLPFKLDRCIWVHAVSVGETMAAVPLIEKLIERYPEYEVLVTSSTPTGSDRVKKIFGDSVWHAYAPFDLSMSVKHFFSSISPEFIIVLETEIWPNMVVQAHKLGIPLVVANARMSERSFRRYDRFSFLSERIFSKIPLISAQSQSDAVRFVKLGAHRSRVEVTGSLKFDLNLPERLKDTGKALRKEWGQERLICIAASTHDKEEALILKVFNELLLKYRNLMLVLVPRHPERFDQVASIIESFGFTYVRRSLGEKVDTNVNVLLGDTMGEMLYFFSAGDLAIVGGSFVGVGGHNMLEPMACGLPTVVGPHMFNFQSITDMLLDHRALIQARNESQLALELDRLCRNVDLRTRLGARGAQLVQENRGALERLLSQIETLFMSKTA